MVVVVVSCVFFVHTDGAGFLNFSFIAYCFYTSSGSRSSTDAAKESSSIIRFTLNMALTLS
jgi:hypothetical protein